MPLLGVGLPYSWPHLVICLKAVALLRLGPKIQQFYKIGLKSQVLLDEYLIPILSDSILNICPFYFSTSLWLFTWLQYGHEVNCFTTGAST